MAPFGRNTKISVLWRLGAIAKYAPIARISARLSRIVSKVWNEWWCKKSSENLSHALFPAYREITGILFEFSTLFFDLSWECACNTNILCCEVVKNNREFFKKYQRKNLKNQGQGIVVDNIKYLKNHNKL